MFTWKNERILKSGKQIDKNGTEFADFGGFSAHSRTPLYKGALRFTLWVVGLRSNSRRRFFATCEVPLSET